MSFSYGCAGLAGGMRAELHLKVAASQYPLRLVQLVAAPCIRRFLLAYLSESEANLLSLLNGGNCCNGRHCMTKAEIDASIPVLPPKKSTRVGIGAHSKQILETVLRPFLSRYSETLAQVNNLVVPIGLGSLFAESEVVLAESLRTFVACEEPCHVTAFTAHLAATIPPVTRPLLWILDPGLERLGIGLLGLWDRLWVLVQPARVIQELEFDGLGTQETGAELGVCEIEDQALGMEGLRTFDLELEPGISQQSQSQQAMLVKELEPPASARFDVYTRRNLATGSSSPPSRRRALSSPESRVNLRSFPGKAQQLPRVVEAFGEELEIGAGVEDRVYSIGVGPDGVAGRKRQRPKYLEGYDVEYSSSPTKSPCRPFR